MINKILFVLSSWGSVGEGREGRKGRVGGCRRVGCRERKGEDGIRTVEKYI